MKVLTLTKIKTWILQKYFILYLYSVLVLVFTIFILLVFLGISNPDFFNVIKQYFILNTSNLNTNIFLSSYTHTNPTHLIENVLSYIILFLLVFHLVDDKKKIKQLMFLGLIAFPFINTLLLVLLTDISAGGGLSGINACFYGYLFFAISYNLKNNSHYTPKKYTILGLIIFNLLTAFFFILKNPYFIVSAIVILSVLFYSNLDIVFNALKYLKSKKSDDEKFLLCIMWVFTLLFAMSTFIILAPVFPTQLNIEYPPHYIGWFYGLICSWVILK